jgi:hypothetical protein
MFSVVALQDLQDRAKKASSWHKDVDAGPSPGMTA